MDQGVNITSFLYDPRLRADRESGENGGKGGEGGREGEIPTLITSWVTAPAGRCQNPTLSDVLGALENVVGVWGGLELSDRRRNSGNIRNMEKG